MQTYAFFFRNRVLIAGVAVTNCAFVGAAVYLYRLGCAILRDEPHACAAALLFCFNPAGIFFSAVYTESVFALATFAGMYYGMRHTAQCSYCLRLKAGQSFYLPAATSQALMAALCFAGSSSIRGNGLVNLGFLFYMGLQRTAHVYAQSGSSVAASAVGFAGTLASTAFYTAIAAGPWIAFQVCKDMTSACAAVAIICNLCGRHKLIMARL